MSALDRLFASDTKDDAVDQDFSYDESTEDDSFIMDMSEVSKEALHRKAKPMKVELDEVEVEEKKPETKKKSSSKKNSSQPSFSNMDSIMRVLASYLLDDLQKSGYEFMDFSSDDTAKIIEYIKFTLQG